MTLEQIEKRMRDIEFKLQNMQDSFNPNSGKEADYEREVYKLLEEYNNISCSRALLVPYDEIEYGEIDDRKGIIMGFVEFRDRCGKGEFTDDNGYAYYVSNETRVLETINVEVKPSWALGYSYRRDFNEVVWYFEQDIEIDNQAKNTVSFEDLEEDF